MELIFKVEIESPMSVQDYLRGICGVSRRLIQKSKHRSGGLLLNGEPVRTVDMVNSGDLLVIVPDNESEIEPNPDLSAEIVYEDDNLVVFNKPGGMPVHPSIRHRTDTLANLFAYRYPELTFRSVNRLDKDTSGLCLVAKDPYTANLLQKSCTKVYYAAVEGDMPPSGTIDAPIARQQESIIVRCVRGDGKRAVTRYRTIGRSEKYSLLEIDLETGRTHQIRVHFSHIGHPLAGDDLYGGGLDDIRRQALHCGKMTVTLPMTGEIRTFTAKLPEDIVKLGFNDLPDK